MFYPERSWRLRNLHTAVCLTILLITRNYVDADMTGMPDQIMGDGGLPELPPARFCGPADNDMGEIVSIGIGDDFA
ncbi:hypothetical protein D3C71_1698600 [compost metagenome]